MKNVHITMSAYLFSTITDPLSEYKSQFKKITFINW